MRRTKELLHVSVWLALAGYAVPSAATSEPDADWNPVREEQLDQMRGGFISPGGLQVSLGIERLVSINGELVARTRLDISNLNHLSDEQLRQTRDALSSVKLIQNGRDNIYQAAQSAHAGAGAGVVIQNTLNDQLIRSQTVISSTVNSASLLKAINFQNSVSDALATAAGAR
jgi:hypothetical protein